MRVTTRRLLDEQMAVVVASDSGRKDDAMWCHNATAVTRNNPFSLSTTRIIFVTTSM